MLSHPFLYLLIILPYFIALFHSCEGDVTVSPALACVGEQVRVQCNLNVPNGDMFLSPEIMFIVGNSDTPFTQSEVNTGVGDPLNRLTAFGDISSSTTMRLIGSMNLSSFTSSDNGLLIGCSGRYQPGGTGAAVDFMETVNLTAAEPPSTPTNIAVSLSSLSAANCTNALISWTAPATTDRSIDRYYLYRNSSLIADDITDTSYTDTDQLLVDTPYQYSVVANSCAGNSSEGVKSIVIKGYSLVNTGPSSLDVNYIASNMQLTLDWTLSPAADTLLLNYSLALSYSHSQYETVDEFTNSAFSLPSDASTYSVLLTPPSFSTPDGVDTNITACIRITSQCGMASSGEMLCGNFSSANPPTTTQHTQPTTTPTTNELTITSSTSINPSYPTTTPTVPQLSIDSATYFSSIFIAVVVTIILMSIIFLSILTLLVVVIVYLLRKIKHLQSLSPPSQPPHPYEYIDLNTALTADTAATPSPHKDSAYYTAMHSAVSVSPPSQGAAPTYANLK